MSDTGALPVALVVHGHFYQPPRENPWTEEVPREPSAAPFHDWNERVALEAYRPNAFARVLDEAGRVVAIVNNYEHLSFDVGPTLSAWLSENEPLASERILAADRHSGGAIAQTYFHVILPLATERDVRTQIRWGLAEFAHRFGRRAEGMWLPETAANDAVLGILAEEGVRFTILAPGQAAQPVAPGVYRWEHPSGDGRALDVVFYDGDLSHAVAFGLGAMSSEAFLDRVQAAAAGSAGSSGGLVVVAADGETFGHHHAWGDRFLAYALSVEAPKRGIEVTNVAAHLSRRPGWRSDDPSPATRREPRDAHRGQPGRDDTGPAAVQVVESSWSCAHGVERWRSDCGCSTGGQPGWDQRWRAPLRKALDLVRDAVDEVFTRRGPGVLRDPDAARDDYVSVLLGASTKEEFGDRHVIGDPVVAFTLLEATRHAMAMYTSCGWFFNDLAGLETVQVMRYAARALDCLDELGEEPPLDAVLGVLAGARSNVASEGDGRRIWRRRVETARVGADRAVAHLALVELLDGQKPAARIGPFDVRVLDHGHLDRGATALCWGHVVLTHRRTGRTSARVYAAVHLGALEVLGAARRPDPASDEAAVSRLCDAFTRGAPLTRLLRLVSDDFGPHEFGLASALPDAVDEIVNGRARRLADRFAGAYERLYRDHRDTIVALAAVGYDLPPELRAPAELVLARELDAEVARQAGSLDPARYQRAVAIARDARESGVALDTPVARGILERLVLGAVEEALRDGAAVDAALGMLEVADDLGLEPSIDRAQELVYDALASGSGAADRLRELGARLGLAV